MVSALTGEGIQESWETMSKFRTVMTESGSFAEKRTSQRKKWMWSYIDMRLSEVNDISLL
jgi:LAO/AO transport system kinase